MARYMMEEYEEYMIEKWYEEETIRTQDKGSAMQYPYLCESCNRNETHGTNRFCDDCKDAGVHLEGHHEYPDPCDPDPYLCPHCGKVVSKFGDFCGTCWICDCCNRTSVSGPGEICKACCAVNDSEYDLYLMELQINSECARKIQFAESAVNIARAEVELAQANLKKAEAMHDISKVRFDPYLHRMEGESELVSARSKLMEAEAEIENAEVALRAAQDAIQVW